MAKRSKTKGSSDKKNESINNAAVMPRIRQNKKRNPVWFQNRTKNITQKKGYKARGEIPPCEYVNKTRT